MTIGFVIWKWFLLTCVGRKAAVCLLHCNNRTVFDMIPSLKVDSKQYRNIGIHQTVFSAGLHGLEGAKVLVIVVMAP